MTREDMHARVVSLDVERKRRAAADERRALKVLYPRSGNVVPLGVSRARVYESPDGDAA